MITRPLDLASRMQPEPRNFDAFFYVNVGLLVLFFMLFGSRFVLAPGLDADLQIPRIAGARAGAMGTTCYISVLRSGQILTADGLVSMAQLPDRLKAWAKKDSEPALLIRASADVPIEDIYRITSIAHGAGFTHVVFAAEDSAALP